jgi:hypothetical protein
MLQREITDRPDSIARMRENEKALRAGRSSPRSVVLLARSGRRTPEGDTDIMIESDRRLDDIQPHTATAEGFVAGTSYGSL